MQFFFFFLFFLPLPYQNNHKENIHIFYLPLFKKLFLGRNNIGGAFAPVHPTSYTYELGNISRAMTLQKPIAVSCGISCRTVQNELRYFQRVTTPNAERHVIKVLNDKIGRSKKISK